jgi:hypothetical protein
MRPQNLHGQCAEVSSKTIHVVKNGGETREQTVLDEAQNLEEKKLRQMDEIAEKPADSSAA